MNFQAQMNLRSGFQAHIHQAVPLSRGGALSLCSSACSTAHPCSAAPAPPCTAGAADVHLSLALHHHCGPVTPEHLRSNQVQILATDEQKVWLHLHSIFEA